MPSSWGFPGFATGVRKYVIQKAKSKLGLPDMPSSYDDILARAAAVIVTSDSVPQDKIDTFKGTGARQKQLEFFDERFNDPAMRTKLLQKVKEKAKGSAHARMLQKMINDGGRKPTVDEIKEVYANQPIKHIIKHFHAIESPDIGRARGSATKAIRQLGTPPSERNNKPRIIPLSSSSEDDDAAAAPAAAHPSVADEMAGAAGNILFNSIKGIVSLVSPAILRKHNRIVNKVYDADIVPLVISKLAYNGRDGEFPSMIGDYKFEGAGDTWISYISSGNGPKKANLWHQRHRS